MEQLALNKSRSIIGVIPARYDSQRLAGKVLLDICGLSMVHRVYQSAISCPLFEDVVVATDSNLVYEHCKGKEIHVAMTSEHSSGTDRVHEIMEKTGAEIYVNIQGDEPTLKTEHFNDLLTPFLSGSEIQVTTLKVAVATSTANEASIVKVVCSKNGNALYFSRCLIPNDRDQLNVVQYYKHLGLYAYTRHALSQFHELPQSALEQSEKLEQLRFLENNIPIHVIETRHDTVSVDTQADLDLAIRHFKRAAESAIS